MTALELIRDALARIVRAQEALEDGDWGHAYEVELDQSCRRRWLGHQPAWESMRLGAALRPV